MLGVITLVVVFSVVTEGAQKQTEELGVSIRNKPTEVGKPSQGAPGPVPDEKWEIPALGMELLYVTPGSFDMGSNEGDSDEKPIHTVRISQGYWMGKYEVTQQQYDTIMERNPSHFKGDENPVESVSWDDAVSFCRRLTGLHRYRRHLPEGYEYRLPTEAEWEYAARGGNDGRSTKFAGSDAIVEVAWYGGNSEDRPHPVGQKQPNELGLYDMTGNVWEWCLDFKARYPSGSQTNPAGPSEGFFCVNRGGGWTSGVSYCRVTNRDYNTSTFAKYTLGFRIVLVPSVPR